MSNVIPIDRKSLDESVEQLKIDDTVYMLCQDRLVVGYYMGKDKIDQALKDHEDSWAAELKVTSFLYTD